MSNIPELENTKGGILNDISCKYISFQIGYEILRGDYDNDPFAHPDIKNRTAKLLLDVAQELWQLYIKLDNLNEK